METIKQYLPSALTLANLACGFAAIQMGDFYWGPIMIMCSFIFDALDGFVARKFKTTSEFGKELDSLCDIVSFGVAPAYLYYLAAPDDSLLSIEGLVEDIMSPKAVLCRLSPILLVLAGATRLAKFNTLPSLPYFLGLPIPSMAMFFTGIIFGIQNESHFIMSLVDNSFTYILLPVIFSVLMVSFRLKMFSTKGMTNAWQTNIYHYILVAFSLIAIVFFKLESMPLIIIAYVILSFIYTLTHRVSTVST